jgi:hypothetical protein
MLQMRARAYALRDGFADVLRGLRIREEVDDYKPIPDVDVEPVGMRTRLVEESIGEEGFTTAPQEAVQADEQKVDADTGEIENAATEPSGPSETDKLADIVDPAIATLAELEDQLRDCASPASIESVKLDLRDKLNALHGEDRKAAHALITRAYSRI